MFEELKKGGAVFILPVKEPLDRYDWHIYNAVVDQLEHAGLGFDKGVMGRQACRRALLCPCVGQHALPALIAVPPAA